MNTIGLDHEKSKVLAEHLNDLLANYMVFYQNVRGFHWNIKGEKFFELHLKFEELYNNVLLKVDELAERILTLESTPLHSFEDYVQISSIKSTKDISEGKEALKHILSAFQVIIVKQRNILSVASEAGDEGTNALMSDYIREEEKLVWMYRSYLG
jgi:starvation-inducible DNA-binding protein